MIRLRVLAGACALAASFMPQIARAEDFLYETTARAPARDRPGDERDEHRGVLGPFRLGLLMGAGFPSLTSGQLVFKIHDWVGLTASYGETPNLAMPIGQNTSLAQHGFDATLRVYPFRGAFFLGLGLGRNTITGRATETASSVTAVGTASTTTLYALPEVGFMYRFSFGLAVGADIGVQLPISGSSTTTASVAGTSVGVPDEVSRTIAAIETSPIPVVHVLRLGWVL